MFILTVESLLSIQSPCLVNWVYDIFIYLKDFYNKSYVFILYGAVLAMLNGGGFELPSMRDELLKNEVMLFY